MRRCRPFSRNEMGFGGNNGLTDFQEVLGYSLQSDGTRIVLFILSALALAGGYLLCLARSTRSGRAPVAIRDSDVPAFSVIGWSG